MLTRRSLVAAGLLAPVAARAQTGSGATIRLINPFPAGGSSDAIARMMQPSLQKRLGSTVIVENKPGASASIGGAMVAKSPPDGTTWLWTADSFVVSSLLMSNLPYDVQKDFEPVTVVARGAMVLCASSSRSYRTFADVVAAAKERPDTLTYATTGIGSNGHMTVAALCQLTGTRMVHVPYRGVAPASNDAIAGHVDLIISSTASLAPQIEAGQLRAVIQCGEKRATFMPDVPTAIESGFPSIHTYSWFGFFAPPGTPKPIIDRFYREVSETAREEPIMRALIDKYRIEVPLMPPDAMRAMIAEELPFYARIIRENNIKGGT